MIALKDTYTNAYDGNKIELTKRTITKGKEKAFGDSLEFTYICSETKLGSTLTVTENHFCSLVKNGNFKKVE